MNMAGEFRTNLKDVTGQSKFDASKPGVLPNAFANVSDPKNQNEVLLGMGGSIDSVQKRGSALAKHHEAVRKQAERGRRSTSDSAFLQMLDQQIRDFEAATAKVYGEDFAENLLADLQEKGLVSDDDVDRINKIADQDERRREIAKLIKQGIDDGSIKPEDLDGHPWSKEWLDLHAKRQAEAKREADAVISGKQSVEQTSDKGLALAAQSEAQADSDLPGALEEAARDRTHDNEVEANAQGAFASFDLNSLG